MNEVNATITKFGYPGTLLREYEHWVVLFRLKQVTIGSVVIAAKSGAAHVGGLSPEIWAEFSQVSSDVEQWLGEAFGAKKFNYLALMMKDPNVHFHIIPRYDAPVTVNGEEFIDTDWPLMTQLQEVSMSDTTKSVTKQEILKVIK